MNQQAAKMLEAIDRARPLCPDHRDKQHGKKCLACRIEALEKALQFYANRDNWRSRSDSLALTLLDPEHVSSKITGNERSGISGGWEVAENALCR